MKKWTEEIIIYVSYKMIPFHICYVVVGTLTNLCTIVKKENIFLKNYIKIRKSKSLSRHTMIGGGGGGVG